MYGDVSISWNRTFTSQNEIEMKVDVASPKKSVVCIPFSEDIEMNRMKIKENGQIVWENG